MQLGWLHSSGWLLPVHEIEPIIMMVDMGTGTALKLVHFLTHTVAPSALRVLVVLFDSGFDTATAVGSEQEWYWRLETFFTDHPCTDRYKLGAADFVLTQAGLAKVVISN